KDSSAVLGSWDHLPLPSEGERGPMVGVARCAPRSVRATQPHFKFEISGCAADNSNSVAKTLYDLIPRDRQPTNDLLLQQFLEYTDQKGLRLYPAQETAILELFEEKNVILNTPTGSGKSLVATALHFKALAQG